MLIYMIKQFEIREMKRKLKNKLPFHSRRYLYMDDKYRLERKGNLFFNFRFITIILNCLVE